jgi:Protein of unknown function (DUF4242)
MPRYLVVRTFPEGLSFPVGQPGRDAAAGVTANNITEGVSWAHSYVTTDDRKTYCVYDGPNPEAIRTVAERNGLPVDEVIEVRVLDPYAYGT